MEGEFMTLETAKIKALFPEGVEAVVVRKDDYDRLYGDLTLENIELKQTLESIEKYIRKYDTNTLDTKTLCILNDILLIKSGIIIEKVGRIDFYDDYFMFGINCAYYILFKKLRLGRWCMDTNLWFRYKIGSCWFANL